MDTTNENSHSSQQEIWSQPVIDIGICSIVFNESAMTHEKPIGQSVFAPQQWMA